MAAPAALPRDPGPPRRATPAPASAPLAADARTAALAVLRWRAWWLGHHLPGRQAEAARLLPALLHASFASRGLSGDAPGLPGLRFRRRWSTLARSFGLPPPHRMQRGRPLLEGVVGLPTGEGLEAALLVAPGLAPEEQAAVQERLEAAQLALAAGGAPIRAGIFDRHRLAAEPEAAQRIVAYGGLLAGSVSEAAWAPLQEGSRRAVDPRVVAGLAAAAPTPLATLALTLLSRYPCPPPLPAMLACLVAGEPARLLADPDLFAVRWASRVEALRGPLEEALRLSRRPRPAEAGELDAMLRLGQRLALAGACAIRRARGPVDRFARRLWQEALGPGMPRVLLPALGDRLRVPGDRLALEPVRTGRAYEVRTREGALLGRGRGPVQARVRALGLCAQALAAAGGETAAAAALAHLDPTWRALVRRLARPRQLGDMVMVVEAGDGSRPGPPFDLLNRGRERAMEFEGAVAVALVPGRRPAGRMLGQAETVETILRRSREDAPVEVLAARPESRPVATRLAQIASLLVDPSVDGPVAIEAGGLVYTPFRGGFRRYTLDSYASRPRAFTPDPEAPDLGGVAERQRRARLGAGTVSCSVALTSELWAALVYADGEGGTLREVVPLAELEEHLRETRAIVAAGRPPAILAVRHAEEVEPGIRLVGQRRGGLGVEVVGELPTVEAAVGGERFGGRAALGWPAAAEKVLSLWPPGAPVRAAVNSVTVTVRGRPAQALLALWAASVARRRLRSLLGRYADAYRRGPVRRIGG